MVNTPEEALDLMKKLGANKRLLQHLQLVGEAGDELISAFEDLKIKFDANFVKIGITIHDAGKIVHPEELNSFGDLHEEAGMKLLLQNDVQEEIAKCCVSHAKFETEKVSFEELLVALADKLWKGKRHSKLEMRVVEHIAELLHKQKWEVFAHIDNEFEKIASNSDKRLSRSF